MKNNRLTVKEAADLMGATQQFVRCGLAEGKFPWGYAVKTSSKWTYFISAPKFEECTGIKLDKYRGRESQLQVDKVSFDIPYKSFTDMLKEAEYFQQAQRYRVGGQL